MRHHGRMARTSVLIPLALLFGAAASACGPSPAEIDTIVDDRIARELRAVDLGELEEQLDGLPR